MSENHPLIDRLTYSVFLTFERALAHSAGWTIPPAAVAACLIGVDVGDGPVTLMADRGFIQLI